MFCQLEWHWETQECGTIHHLGAFIKKKTHWCTGERERQQQRDPEIQHVCLPVCVRVCYVSIVLKDSHGVKVEEVFSLSVME